MISLPHSAEQFLVPVPAITTLGPDPNDIDMSRLIQDWHKVEKPLFGIVGVPYDTSTLSRRGSKFGPAAIRAAFNMSSSYDAGYDIDLSDGGPIADFGNVKVVETNPIETYRRVEIVVEALLGAGLTPIVLGGDHSITYATVKALCDTTNGKTGLINFDAHYDIREFTTDEVADSGFMLRRLINDLPRTSFDPRNFVELGVIGWRYSRSYAEYVRRQGIHQIAAREIHERGTDWAVEEALARASDGTKAIFFTFDMDVLDCAYVAGTSYAYNVGGLTSHQAREITFKIGCHPLVKAMDLMEVAPGLDVTGITPYVGATMAMQFMAGKIRAKSK